MGSSPTPYSSDYSYYVSFIDGLIRYTWIYLIKDKNDALFSSELFRSYVMTQFNANIKGFQSDHGGEFRLLTKYLNQLGIVHRLTLPHTSQPNRTVERKHKKIMKMGITLLAHASLLIKFWDHSFTIIVYLINILPITALLEFASHFSALHNKLTNYK